MDLAASRSSGNSVAGRGDAISAHDADLSDCKPNGYSDDDVRYLTRLADHVALAVDNALRDEELRKQKADFEKLFELAPEAIVLRDIDNRVLRANREFTQLFGFRTGHSAHRHRRTP